MQVHGLSVAARQDEAGSLAFLRANCSEDIGRRRALVFGRARPRASFRPSTCDLVLLADTRLVGEPDLYIAGLDALFLGDLFQARGEVFLNSSIAPSTCA